MKVLVTAKRVTDPDAQIRLKADLSNIETEGLEFKINPFDENAVEAAVVLKENGVADEVIVASIGPDESTQYIRTALAMGCDRGVRVEADDMELDGDLVARALKAVAAEENVDLILIGKQAIDGDSNQVGQLIAEYMGIGQATFVNKIDVDGGKITARREVDGGLETLALTTPAVITADLRLNEPRYPSLPNIMKAKRKKIAVKDFGDLGVDTALKVKTVAYEKPSERQAGITVPDVDTLLDKLRNEAKALG